MEAPNEYVRQLEVLQKVRDVSDGELNLPQICVAGDQTAGKSALLTCLTGIPVPVKSGICTKAPIVVECRHSATLQAANYEIQDPVTKVYRSVDASTLPLEIDNVQKAAMEKLLQGHTNGTERPKVSQEEIRLRVRGPEQTDIVVVDLPGMINAGDGKEVTRDLIRRYIKEKQTLILLVSEAKQDAELTGAIDLAKEFDPYLSRTLRVLTKFDTFDSQDARDTAIRLIRSQMSSNLGAHAVVCRSGGGEYSAETESQVLADAQVPGFRAGVQALKERLPPIYAQLILTNLIGLKEAAESKLSIAQKDLGRIGSEPLDPVAMIRECQTSLIAKFPEVEQLATPAMKAFKEAIHTTEKQITQEWVSARLKENVFRCPFFQGEDAFLRCLKEITEMWRPHMQTLIDTIHGVLSMSMKYVESDTTGVSKTLSDCIQATWSLHHEPLVASFKSHCIATLAEEVDFGTMNHYLVDKYAEEMLLPDEFLKDFLSHLRWDDLHAPVKHSEPTLSQRESGPYYTGRAAQATKAVPWSDNLGDALNRAKQAWVVRYKQRTLHEHLEQRVFAAVKAAWAVEKKTFTDMEEEAEEEEMGFDLFD